VIPTVPLLERTALRSGLSGAAYFERALVMMEPNWDTMSDETFIREAFEYNASLFHEQVHWLQSHGTTFGAFLYGVDLSQRRTSLRHLRELSRAQIRRLLDQRPTIPILEYDAATQYPRFRDDDKEGLNIFRQIWHDHQWVYSTFLDDRGSISLDMPPGEIFGQVVSDVVLALSEFPGFSFAQDEHAVREIRKWYTFPERPTILRFEGRHLTTRSLMECAATVAELMLLRGWAQLLRTDVPGIVEMRESRLADGHYGLPLAMLRSATTAAPPGDPWSLLITVSLMCFAALNPPLPPFVSSAPIGKASWTWDQLYPPVRFLRLISVVDAVGYFRPVEVGVDHKSVTEYLEKICERAGIFNGAAVSYPRKPGESVDFASIPESDLPPSPLSASDYVLWVHERLSDIRRSRLPFVALLAQCSVGEGAAKYADLLLTEASPPFSRCPLIARPNGKAAFSCNKKFGNWILATSASDYVLFDLIVGTGEYDLAPFPREADNSALRSMLVQAAEHSLLEVRNV
jgi:hypothetical protein